MGAQNNLTRHRHGPGECDNCGQRRKRLYCYGGHWRPFCSLDCWLSYHCRSRSDFDFVEFK